MFEFDSATVSTVSIDPFDLDTSNYSETSTVDNASPEDKILKRYSHCSKNTNFMTPLHTRVNTHQYTSGCGFVPGRRRSIVPIPRIHQFDRLVTDTSTSPQKVLEPYKHSDDTSSPRDDIKINRQALSLMDDTTDNSMDNPGTPTHFHDQDWHGRFHRRHTISESDDDDGGRLGIGCINFEDVKYDDFLQQVSEHDCPSHTSFTSFQSRNLHARGIRRRRS
mmetsp:Transcript_16657/g.37447  ORF Transcript_16657/g.37447 Transcript_16657/m.37447 type:complete len:221 (-) Transcript_16657:227-889(-)